MKCAYHNEIDAVSTCSDCGVGLCLTCTREFEEPICSGCNQKRVNSDAAAWKQQIALTVVAGIVGFFVSMAMWKDSGVAWSMVPIGTYALAGLPYGWKALDRITPSIFLVLPLAGWAIYFLIKFFLAYWVGLVALPYNLIKIVTNRRRLSTLQSAVTDAATRQAH